MAMKIQGSRPARVKDVQIIGLMWSLFAGAKVPDKAHATRDTLTMFYTQLLLYRKARQEMHAKAMKGICDRVNRAVAAAVHPSNPVSQNN